MSKNRKKNKPHNLKTRDKAKKPKQGFDIFGIHAVSEAILNPKRHIHEIVATKTGVKSIETALNKARQKGLVRPDVKIIDKEKLTEALSKDTVHQGVAIRAQDLHVPELEKFCQNIKTGNIKENIFIILDQVTDPLNIGSILRSSAVFGAKALIVQKKHSPETKASLAKVASGAVEHVPVFRETNISRTIRMLQDLDILCIGLDERGNLNLSEVIADKNLTSYKGIGLVMGAEGEGLRRLTAENCDILAKLPAKGKIKSLNVANAAAVAIYELVR